MLSVGHFLYSSNGLKYYITVALCHLEKMDQPKISTLSAYRPMPNTVLFKSKASEMGEFLSSSLQIFFKILCKNLMHFE